MCSAAAVFLKIESDAGFSFWNFCCVFLLFDFLLLFFGFSVLLTNRCWCCTKIKTPICLLLTNKSVVHVVCFSQHIFNSIHILFYLFVSKAYKSRNLCAYMKCIWCVAFRIRFIFIIPTLPNTSNLIYLHSLSTKLSVRSRETTQIIISTFRQKKEINVKIK